MDWRKDRQKWKGKCCLCLYKHVQHVGMVMGRKAIQGVVLEPMGSLSEELDQDSCSSDQGFWLVGCLKRLWLGQIKKKYLVLMIGKGESKISVFNLCEQLLIWQTQESISLSHHSPSENSELILCKKSYWNEIIVRQMSAEKIFIRNNYVKRMPWNFCSDVQKEVGFFEMFPEFLTFSDCRFSPIKGKKGRKRDLQVQTDLYRKFPFFFL